ncbi:hypothetical protein QQ045_023558 [Rhodiola kirilowii]
MLSTARILGFSGYGFLISSNKVVADNLSDDLIEDIKEMFHTMDTDKNGSLTFDELKNGLHNIGHAVPESDVHMLMDALLSRNESVVCFRIIDDSMFFCVLEYNELKGGFCRNGMLNCEEFVTMSVHLRRIGSDEHLDQAFQYFDKNKVDTSNSRSCRKLWWRMTA